MPGMQFGFEADAKQVSALFRQAPELTLREIRRLIERSAIDVQRRMMQEVNVGATGDTRRSIRYTVNPFRLEAEVKPNVPNAEALEYGSRPHWTSVKDGTPLAQWAKFRGINKYAVQRSIARKGTKAHPFVRPTYNEMKPVVLRDIATGVLSLARRLDSGRL